MASLSHDLCLTDEMVTNGRLTPQRLQDLTRFRTVLLNSFASAIGYRGELYPLH